MKNKVGWPVVVPCRTRKAAEKTGDTSKKPKPPQKAALTSFFLSIKQVIGLQ